MEGGPCRHQGHFRGCRRIERAEEEVSQQKNTVKRIVSRSGRDKSSMEVLCGHCHLCLVGSRSLRLPVHVAELLPSPPPAAQVLPGEGGQPHSSMDTLPGAGHAQSPEADPALPFLSTCSGYNVTLAHYNQVLLVGKVQCFICKGKTA